MKDGEGPWSNSASMAEVDPPPEPSEAEPAVPPPPPPPARPRERKWAPVFVILGVLAVVTLGGLPFVAPGINAVGGTTEPGVPIEVAPGVTVTPLAGWQIGETVSPEHRLRLIKGNGFLDLFSVSAVGSSEDVYLAYVNDVLGPETTQLQFQEDPEPVGLDGGLEGARGGYSGTFEGVSAPIEGEVTGVLTLSGGAFAFDGWAQQGQFGQIAEEVREMVESMEAV